MNICFSEPAWQEYCDWLDRDAKTASKIRALIKDILRSPFQGIGKPEPLKYQYSGYWSRRIDGEHRLVYTVKSETLYIVQCRFHY